MSDGSAPPAAPKMVQGAQADESQPQPQQKRATEANSHEEASAPRPDTTMESMEDMAAAEPQRDASGDLGVAESVRPQVDLSVDDAEAASEYGHVAQDTVAQTTEAVAQGEQPAHLREFFDDIFNMVNDYTADGYDAFEEFVRENLPMSEEVSQKVMKLIQSFYIHTCGCIEEAMNDFEARARRECFHHLAEKKEALPVLDACQGEAGTHIEYSAEAEEALDKELAELRRNLALTRASTKQLKQDIRGLDQFLAQHGSQDGRGSLELQEVMSHLGQHEVADGAQELEAAASRLRPLLSRAEEMRARRTYRADHDPERARIAAAKALNRRKLAMSGATVEDLRRLRQKMEA